LELGLPTLERRREQADMIQAYKVLHGVDDVDHRQWFELYSENQITRGQRGEYKLKTQRSRLELRGNFFSQRVVPKWNELPEELRTCTNIKMFKTSVRTTQTPGGAGL